MTVPPHRSKMVQIFQGNKWSTDWWNIMKYHPKKRICYHPTYKNRFIAKWISTLHSQASGTQSLPSTRVPIRTFAAPAKVLQAPSRNFTPRGLDTLREIREWNKANFICYIFNIASPITMFNAIPVQKHKKRLNEIGAINGGSDSSISTYDMYVNIYI